MVNLRKNVVFILITALLSALSIYLISVNLSLRRTLLGLDKKKEAEFNQRILKEREFIKKDLDEKYRADMVSFEAMHKRLEIEKKRFRELEEKLKQLTSEPVNQ